MKDEEPQPNSLSEQQLKQPRVKHLAEQLEKIIEMWEDQNGITEEYYEDLSKQHIRTTTKR